MRSKVKGIHRTYTVDVITIRWKNVLPGKILLTFVSLGKSWLSPSKNPHIYTPLSQGMHLRIQLSNHGMVTGKF